LKKLVEQEPGKIKRVHYWGLQNGLYSIEGKAKPVAGTSQKGLQQQGLIKCGHRISHICPHLSVEKILSFIQIMVLP